MPDVKAIARARSFLFVPGHRPERFAKAAASGAHQIILDLEDAVGPAEKGEALGAISTWLGQGGAGIVRINAADSSWFASDLKALAAHDCAIMLPKAEPEALAALRQILPYRPVLALVETVAGLLRLGEIARENQISRVAFGNLDFTADAGLTGEGRALDHARFQINMMSRMGGLPAPIDGVTIALEDAQSIADDVKHARDFGFGGKLCIHPKQVQAVNQGFAPSQSEVDWAERIIQAINASGGAAVQVDGKMVDRPMLTRAHAVLADHNF